MLFFKKKKLIEMDQKIDLLIGVVEKQEELINSYFQYIDKLMNQQNEMKEYLEARMKENLSAYISDALKKEMEYYNLLQKQIHEVQNQIIQDFLKGYETVISNLESDKEEIKESVSKYIEQTQKRNMNEITQLFATMNQSLEKLAETMGNHYSQIKNSIIEEIKRCDDNITSETTQKFNEMQNSQDKIRDLLEIKLKETEAVFTSVSERNSECYNLLQEQVDGAQNRVIENIFKRYEMGIESARSDKEELKKFILRYFEQMQAKNIKEIISLCDPISNDLKALLKNIENGYNQTKDELYKLNNVLDSTTAASASKILDSNEDIKRNILEICNDMVKQGHQRFYELKNGQDEIKNQFEIKSEDFEKKYIYDVSEKNKEHYGLLQSQINDIAKLFGLINGNIDMLSSVIEYNQGRVIDTLCETNNVIGKLDGNSESIKQDMELLDNGLRMLLLNSIMEQLP